jgi:hypothetical protein
MHQIWEKLRYGFGSVGIAALAVAILLVPYADLNADCSSGVLCDSTCFGSGDPPDCSCGGGCSPCKVGVTCVGCAITVVTLPNGGQECSCACSAQ